MTSYFKDKVIIVTGASSGIGLASARLFGSLGARVVMAARRLPLLQELAPSVAPADRVLCVGCDVSSEADTAALVDATVKRFGRIDILINNAGMFFFHELDPETQGKAITMLQLHIMTPTRLVMLFGEAMKERRRGYIIHVSSLAAKLPVPGITFYSATKAYLKTTT